MSKLTASAGLAWIRQGFGLFRKQPGGLMLLMLAFMVVAALLSIIPLLGQLAQFILAPVFTAVFVQACAAIDGNQRLTPDMLRPIFQKPIFPRLAGLGSLFVLAAALLAVVMVSIVGSDTIRALAEQKLTPEAAAAGNFGWAMLVVFLLSLPLSMAMLFAAPLIYWQQMGVGKSLFYSFFAVWRALRTFILFFACWVLIIMLTTKVVLLLAGGGLFGMALVQSLWMIIAMIFQCAVYAAYCGIFGAPGSPASPSADNAG